jgi:hypothetical protein
VTEQPIHVVYHTAGMGPEWYWKQVVAEQLALLRDVGLTDVRATHVGQGAEWVRSEAARRGIDLTLVRADPNTDHSETFAIAEVERLAKEGADRPILYLHTKGVSAPHHLGKLKWRKFMEFHTVRQWRWNVTTLTDHHCVGVNWIDADRPPHEWGHFCGTFWIARPDWLRQLPSFWRYHDERNRVRSSCEQWIGSSPGVRPWSLVCRNQNFWHDDFDWSQLGPWNFRCEVDYPPDPVRLNLGCWIFYHPGWVNVDLNPGVRADRYEDVSVLPSVGPDSVDEIYAGHVAEHVADVGTTLRRWLEVLKPGGKITITVPDAEGANRLWIEGREFPVLGHPPDRGALAVMTGYHSRDEIAGDPDRLHMHRRAFDRSTLVLCMTAVGFSGVRLVDDHPIMVKRCSELGWQFALEGFKPIGQSGAPDGSDEGGQR